MRRRFSSRRTILPRLDFCPFWAWRLPSVRPSLSAGKHYRVAIGRLAKILPSCTQPRTVSSLCRRRSTTRAFGGGPPVERFTSGALIADAHCNLSISSLFTSLFSFFLNYLKCYLSNNEISKEQKKNWTCRFFALWLMSSFLRKKKMFCVFSLFPCRKKRACCL